MQIRNGLLVASQNSQSSGIAEREAPIRMAISFKGAHQKTLAADKVYDTRSFAFDLRISGITPHVFQSISRSGKSAFDCRTARHLGDALSINVRKWSEQVFGWITQSAGLSQLMS